MRPSLSPATETETGMVCASFTHSTFKSSALRIEPRFAAAAAGLSTDRTFRNLPFVSAIVAARSSLA